MAVELFGVGIAPRHHRRVLGDAQVGLPQPHAMLPGQAVDALNRRMQQLGIGREGDVLGLHGSIDRDSRQVLRSQRAALVRHPLVLGQQRFQFVAEALPPMAQVGVLVWEAVLEELARNFNTFRSGTSSASNPGFLRLRRPYDRPTKPFIFWMQ